MYLLAALVLLPWLCDCEEALFTNQLICSLNETIQLTKDDVMSYHVDFGSDDFIELISTSIDFSEGHFSSSQSNVPNAGYFILNNDFVLTGFTTQGEEVSGDDRYVSKFSIVIVSNSTEYETYNKTFEVNTRDGVYFPIYPHVPSREIRFNIIEAIGSSLYYWKIGLYGCQEVNAFRVIHPSVCYNQSLNPSKSLSSMSISTTAYELQSSSTSTASLSTKEMLSVDIQSSSSTASLSKKEMLSVDIQSVCSPVSCGSNAVAAQSDIGLAVAIIPASVLFILVLVLSLAIVVLLGVLCLVVHGKNRQTSTDISRSHDCHVTEISLNSTELYSVPAHNSPIDKPASNSSTFPDKMNDTSYTASRNSTTLNPAYNAVAHTYIEGKRGTLHNS